MSWVIALVWWLLPLSMGRKTQLRVAFVYYEATTDFSWTWRMNQGRIYMVGQLLDLYPDLSVQTYYRENIPEDAPPNCSPVLEELAQQKMDLIFGTSYGYQFCMAQLAPKYPDTIWVPLTGDTSLPLPNWGLGHAKIQQAIFLAGMVAGRETRTGKVGACMPIRIPETYSHLAAFAQGVAAANASVQVVAVWTETWQTPQRDVFAVQRMVADNIDIIWHRCGTLEGVNEAAALGVRSIGFNSEFKMLAGETLLLAPYYNWGILLLEIARLVVEGNWTAASPVDVFPGLESGAVGLSDPSYLVHKATMTPVLAMEAAMAARLNDTFCGPMLTNTGKTVGKAGSCLTLKDLRAFDWEPWNVVDVGHFALPSEACVPGEQSHWDEAREKYICTACPAGTFSQLFSNLTFEAYTCQPCPANTYAPHNATACSACPSGTAVSADQAGCAPVPLGTAVLVGIVVGSLLGSGCLAALAVGAWHAWKATADLRRLRKQFSNNNVAQECAEAIACFNLESVAWLRTCPNPNKIQQAFLQILEMMTMVRPYIPDHVLSLFTQRQPHLEAPEPKVVQPAPDKAEGSGLGPNVVRRIASDVSSVVQPRSSPSPGAAVHSRPAEGGGKPPQYVQVTGHGSSEASDTSSVRGRKGRPGNDGRLLPNSGEWVPRRCAYMSVSVAFAPSGLEDEEEAVLHYMSQVLGEVVAIAKNFSATIDHVAYDRVALHWGLVGAVSEGALKATQAALEMGKARGRLPLPWRSLLRLSVAVVHGVGNVSTISAAGHSFFVVGGPLLRQLSDLAASGLAAKCQCEILVSASVHQQVQYAVECMPRCFLGDTLFWQPVGPRVGGAPADEWMYELHHLEADQVDKWCSRSLYSVFQLAAQSRDSEALHLKVGRLQEQFKGQMSPQDEASLQLLLAPGTA